MLSDIENPMALITIKNIKSLLWFFELKGIPPAHPPSTPSQTPLYPPLSALYLAPPPPHPIPIPTSVRKSAPLNSCLVAWENSFGTCSDNAVGNLWTLRFRCSFRARHGAETSKKIWNLPRELGKHGELLKSKAWMLDVRVGPKIMKSMFYSVDEILVIIH